MSTSRKQKSRFPPRSKQHVERHTGERNEDRSPVSISSLRFRTHPIAATSRRSTTNDDQGEHVNAKAVTVDLRSVPYRQWNGVDSYNEWRTKWTVEK